LLNVSGLQAVLVETRVRDLLNTAESCIAAGKHVHLDKPAGESLPQFGRLLDEAARRNLLVQLGYMYRYNPGVLLLGEMMKRGWLGEPFEVHTVMSKVVEPAARRQLAQFSGGIMFELGCHVIDLVIGLLGNPSRITPFSQHVAHADDSLKDNMLATFEYPRAIATIKSSAVEVEGFQRRHLVVCGTEGTFQIQPLDDPTVRVAFSTDHDPYHAGYQDIALPKFKRYVADAADMARIVRGEKKADYTYEHDRLVQQSLLQACGPPVK
jgi:predicted dehydrogenase